MIFNKIKIDFAKINSFTVSISIAKVVFCKERVFAAARISNTGDKIWEQPVKLTYHMYGADGELLHLCLL